MQLKKELELQIKVKSAALSAGCSLPSSTLFSIPTTPEEVASQLKIIELESLAAIGPEEFIQAFGRGAEKEV